MPNTTNVRVDETNPAELKRYTDAYKGIQGKLPSALSGKVAGTDDSWAAVDHRLRKMNSSLAKAQGGSSSATPASNDSWAAIGQRIQKYGGTLTKALGDLSKAASRPKM